MAVLATGQSVYKQRASEDPELELIDIQEEQRLFLTYIVSLQIIEKETKQVVYLNQRPSSTGFSRPYRFRYVKETEDVLKAELENIKSMELVPTANEDFTIEHSFEVTMIDGKLW